MTYTTFLLAWGDIVLNIVFTLLLVIVTGLILVGVFYLVKYIVSKIKKQDFIRRIIMKSFVIFSFEATQNDLEHEPLFWSNKDGWVSLSTATKFTKEETEWYIMPDDGIAIELP